MKSPIEAIEGGPEKVAPLAGARIEILNAFCATSFVVVAPLAGARIEIDSPSTDPPSGLVAPLAGARIEMRTFWKKRRRVRSLPSRERGLKSIIVAVIFALFAVAPLAGARIEIQCFHGDANSLRSLPSRERGLKLILR